MFNRRGFLRTLLAAPVAAAVGLGLYKPKPIRYKRYMGTMRITGDAMRKLRPKKDAFEVHMVNYHQRMIVQRSGITARAEGSYLPDPDPYGLNR